MNTDNLTLGLSDMYDGMSKIVTTFQAKISAQEELIQDLNVRMERGVNVLVSRIIELERDVANLEREIALSKITFG